MACRHVFLNVAWWYHLGTRYSFVAVVNMKLGGYTLMIGCFFIVPGKPPALHVGATQPSTRVACVRVQCCRTTKKGYEEVHVPALKPPPFAEGRSMGADGCAAAATGLSLHAACLPWVVSHPAWQILLEAA
jgi:hypothetical protein